ncbi:DMT family transporter [Azospirillum halopraeferens]|uniref:DMT family transporter n=1 Tax=Azospirillum halopraeferens TaxID=34010 RepID=UPI001FE1BEC2|nr:DMT family transporter [Azospirillum halopraeferens]
MTAAPHRGPYAGYALFFLASAFMASNVVLGRAAADTVPPVGLAFWRWLVAFALILPFALPGLREHRRNLLADWRRLLVLGALGMGVCGAFVYVGLERTTATNAGLIYASSPVLILLIAAVTTGERVRPVQVAGIALAMAGVLTILARGDPGVLLGLSFNTGDVWILAAATAWAVYTILLRRSRTPFPVVTLFAANALSGVLILAPFYAWETLSGRPVVPTAEAALSVLGVAVIASVLAFLTYQMTIARIGPARAGTTLYVMPLWAALLAWATLGETLQSFHLAGAALILPGVLMATRPAR